MNSYSPGLTEDPAAPEWLQGERGRLAFYSFPAPNPWLHLLISHGFAEHAGWWHHVARAFRDRGISSYLFDYYHHGHSGGEPGDVPDYQVLVDGFHLAWEQGVQPRLQGSAPVVVLGHSNGGLSALLALDGLAPELVQGLVLSSPFLGMPFWVRVGGKALATVLHWIHPPLQVPHVTNPILLTGNKAIWPLYWADPLRFRSISARFFLAMGRAIQQVWKLRFPPERSLLLLTAGKERVVSAQAISDWYDRVGAKDKTRMEYPDLMHELFNEEVWERVVEDVTGWCSARFGQNVASTPASHASHTGSGK